LIVSIVAAQNYATGPAASVAVGDFNGDGQLDIVTGNVDRTISVLLGNGNGTFRQGPTTTGGDGSSPPSTPSSRTGGERPRRRRRGSPGWRRNCTSTCGTAPPPAAAATGRFVPERLRFFWEGDLL
jgi:hypothetical protein